MHAQVKQSGNTGPCPHQIIFRIPVSIRRVGEAFTFFNQYRHVNFGPNT